MGEGINETVAGSGIFSLSFHSSKYSFKYGLQRFLMVLRDGNG